MKYTSFLLSLLFTAIILLTAPLPSRADSLTADVGVGLLVISATCGACG